MLSAALGMADSFFAFFSFASSWRGRLTAHASLECSQFPAAVGHGCIGGGQEHSELRSIHQSTLKLHDQLVQHGTLRHWGPNITGGRASWAVQDRKSVG